MYHLFIDDVEDDDDEDLDDVNIADVYDDVNVDDDDNIDDIEMQRISFSILLLFLYVC